MNLVQFDLNLLVALDALLRERNVTRAGQRLGLSQPAMSGTLARLRGSFHDDLLVRVGRHLELTPLAQELIEPVGQCIARIEDMIDHRRAFDPAREERVFTIAATDYATYLLMPPLLERLSREAPGMTLKFTRLHAKSMDLLGEGRIDFAILPSEIETHYPGELLFIDRWVCAAWSNHPDLGDGLTRDQYLALPHLGFEMPEHEGHSVAELHLADIEVRRHIVATTESFMLAPFMLRGTRFITLVHQRLADRVRAAADIRLYDPPYTLPDIHESIYWNPRHSGAPAHQWLRSRFVEVARAL
jgi:DNA-binding transcriptional LysR family regulator